MTKTTKLAAADERFGGNPEAAKPGTAIAFPNLKSVAVKDEALAAFDEALGDEKPDVIPVMSQCIIDHDNECFMLNGNRVDELEGCVLMYYQSRAWWEKSYNSKQTGDPDCKSVDGISPDADSPKQQHGTCIGCPMSEFGSAPSGEGQACKTNTSLVILNPTFGQIPAAILTVPPTSIQALLASGKEPGYLVQAQSFKNAGRYQLVWGRFHVERAGDRHCVVVGEPLAVANKESAILIAGTLKQLRPLIEIVRGIKKLQPTLPKA